MKIRFTKMHGLGNDFVVLNAIVRNFVPNAAQARYLADRHFGVGCDQILVVAKPTRPDVDFRYRIFNADGSEVEHCGNGARCFVRFVREQGLTDKNQIRVETSNGVITLRMEADGEVTVDMGEPRVKSAEIPFISDSDTVIQPIEVNGRTLDISVVSMGNPHVVQVVADTESALVEQDGPALESHPRFPQKVNVGFMQIENRNAIKLRVYERGSGETLACGTGACAAVVAGIRRGLLDSPVRVTTHGGQLTIAWDGAGSSVRMTGPAVTVFSAELDLPDNL
jgi:diaminopimelate epimerase